MVILFAALCLGMVAIELMVVRSYPKLGAFLERHPGRSLVFSLVLSVLLGVVFPAAGLIVFTAGVFSTVMMQPYYAFKRKLPVVKEKLNRTRNRYRASRLHDFLRTWKQR